MNALDRELGLFVPAQIASAILMQELMDEQEKAETFTQWAESICIRMRRFSTKKGYLGQVPKSAMVGDFICVIAGAAVPFTVRPNDKGYNLIGQCYVHCYIGVGKTASGNGGRPVRQGASLNALPLWCAPPTFSLLLWLNAAAVPLLCRFLHSP